MTARRRTDFNIGCVFMQAALCMQYLEINAVVTPLRKAASYEQRNAVVTPLRKAASYESRIAIFGIWGDTWLTPRKGPVTTTYCHVDAVFATI